METDIQQAHVNSILLEQQRKATPQRQWRVDTRAFGGRININDEWETYIWCRRLGCTAQQLQAAIEIKGTSALALRRYFETRDAWSI